MRVAVPLFGQDVAPRFGFADEFLVVDVLDGNVINERRLDINSSGWQGRLSELRGLGVELLLCGGFNRRFEPLANTMGIEVVSGLAGDVRVLLGSLARGEEFPTWGGCQALSFRARRRLRRHGFRTRDS